MVVRLIRYAIILGAMVFVTTLSAAELVCNSSDGEYHLCPLADADKLKVNIKYHADGECKKGETWGVESKGIWVDLGSKATFRFKDIKSARHWLEKISTLLGAINRKGPPNWLTTPSTAPSC